MKNRQHTHGTIVIVAPAVAREGITKQVANQITGLQQQGIQVCLIILKQSDLSVLEELGVDTSTVPVLQLDQPVAYLSPRALAGSSGLIFPVLKFLKKHQARSVIAHAPYAHFVMRLVKLATKFYSYRFKLVCYFHGLQYSEYPFTTLRRRMVNNLNRWLARRADDAHISVSKAVKEEISKNLIRHTKHEVIYNSLPAQHNWLATDEQVWQKVQHLLHEAAGKFTILLPNRIDHNKGQLFFIEVLQSFLSDNNVQADNVAVFIVGEGPQRHELERDIQQKGLETIVTVMGALPNNVVRKLMQLVDLVVVPSFVEGFPFTVLEAIAEKCVVLASKIGGIPEIIRPQETGFLFAPGNKQQCVSQLLYIYQNRNQPLINYKLLEQDLQTKFSNQVNTTKLVQVLTLEDL